MNKTKYLDENEQKAGDISWNCFGASIHREALATSSVSSDVEIYAQL